MLKYNSLYEGQKHSGPCVDCKGQVALRLTVSGVLCANCRETNAIDSSNELALASKPEGQI